MSNTTKSYLIAHIEKLSFFMDSSDLSENDLQNLYKWYTDSKSKVELSIREYYVKT